MGMHECKGTQMHKRKGAQLCALTEHMTLLTCGRVYQKSSSLSENFGEPTFIREF
jgi:hypothetical protein